MAPFTSTIDCSPARLSHKQGAHFLQNPSQLTALAYLAVFSLTAFSRLTAFAKGIHLGTTVRTILGRFWSVTWFRIHPFEGPWIETFLPIGSSHLQALQALRLSTGVVPNLPGRPS